MILRLNTLTRSDLLNGKFEIGEEHSFSNVMGIAVVDTLRIKAASNEARVSTLFFFGAKK